MFKARNSNEVLKESIDSKSEEEKKVAIQEISALGYQKLLTKVSELLSEEDLIEFGELTDNQEKMLIFLKDRLANFDQLVDQSITETKQSLGEGIIEEMYAKEKDQISKMGGIAFENIISETYPLLDVADQIKLGELLETGEEDTVLNFLKEKNPSFDKLMEEESNKTADKISSLLQRARQEAQK